MPLLQEAGATPGLTTTPTITYPGLTTAGSLGVAQARVSSAATVTSLVDDHGGTWTVLPGVVNGAGQTIFAYRVNMPGAVAPVLTWTFSVAQTAQLNIAEFSNVLTSSPIDQTSTGATGTSTTPLSDSITTTHATELLIGSISMGGTETFTQHGAWLIASGNGAPTARAVLVYKEVTSIVTDAATVDGNSSLAWTAQTISFQQNGPSGSANQGSMGLRGVNDSTHRRNVTNIGGSVGFRGMNTVAGRSPSTNVGSVGFRGQNTSQKIVTDFTAGSMGFRGMNMVALKPAVNKGSIGFRGMNTVAAKASSAQGSFGLRGTNDSTHTHVVSNVGSVGFRGVNDTAHTHTVSNVGSIGFRGMNTVAPKVGSTSGSMGFKGLNTSTAIHTLSAVGSVGFRGQNTSTRATSRANVGSVGFQGMNTASRATARSSVGSLGFQGINASSRHTFRAGLGSVGFRGMNVAVHGTPPTPAPTLVANDVGCVTDWSMPDFVTWPSEVSGAA